MRSRQLSSDVGVIKLQYLITTPKGEMIMMNMYRDANLRGIYQALDTDHERDSCFNIYQNNRIKMYFIFKEAIQCKTFFYF